MLDILLTRAPGGAIHLIPRPVRVKVFVNKALMRNIYGLQVSKARTDGKEQVEGQTWIGKHNIICLRYVLMAKTSSRV